MRPSFFTFEIKTALIFCALCVGSFSASIANARTVRLQFPHAVEISLPGRTGLVKTDSFKPGVQINLAEDTIYWLTAKGKVPMLIVPIDVKTGQDLVRVRMPEVGEWPSAVADRELEKKMTAAIDELIKFQIAISQKNVVAAENSLNELERIKSLEYYHLLRASLRFIKGDLQGARESVRRGLERYPANEHGKQMLKLLEETPK